MTDHDSKTAHHAPDGSFRNPWPDSEPRGWTDVLRWMYQRRGQPRAPDPALGSFPVATPNIVHPRAAAGEFAATWIGHSTVLLQMDGLNVITDPMFGERAFPVQWLGPRRVMPPAIALEALPPLDVVLLSHSHYDHLDKTSAKQIARDHPEAVWVAPLKLGPYLREWSVRNIVELDWWQTADVRGISVSATPARHFSARRIGDRNETLWCGYAFEKNGKRAYFAGDTAFHPEFSEMARQYGPFDFVMMPIGAYDPRWFMHVVHMDPDEALRAYLDLGADPTSAHALMLGIHWGTFRLTDEAMDEPPRLTGELWRKHNLDPAKLWIAKFGETRAW